MKKKEKHKNKQNSSLSCIYPEDEDHCQQSDCRPPRTCRPHSGRTQLLQRVPEAPYGGTSVTSMHNSVSLERNRGSRLTNGEEIERNWPRLHSRSHVRNTIEVVTRPFRYKRRCVHAHVPISVVTQENGCLVKIRISWAENNIRRVQMRTGVACSVV